MEIEKSKCPECGAIVPNDELEQFGGMCEECVAFEDEE